MKRCKKLLCLVLALVMALSLCTVAMADDNEVATVNFAFNDGTFGYGYPKAEVKLTAEVPTGMAVSGVYNDETTINFFTDAECATALATPYINGEECYMQVKFKMLTGLTEGDYVLENNAVITLTNPNGGAAIARENASTALTADNSGVYTVIFKIPAIAKGDYYFCRYVNSPFYKEVTLGGNTEPAAKKFELEWVKPETTSFTPNDPNADANRDIYALENNLDKIHFLGYVNTDGKGNYTGGFEISGLKYYVDLFMQTEGFYVREKNDNAAGWTYDDQLWLIKYESWKIENPTFAFIKVDDMNHVCGELEGGTHDRTNHFDAMTFTNVYTENVVVDEPINRQTVTPAPEAPATKPVASPKTGDMGVALYAAMALLSMSGSAVIIGKKRSK